MPLLVLALVRPSAADIEINVSHVGFPVVGFGNAVRSGQWVPVTVDLALLNEPGFDGYVRLGQYDLDGDECFDRVDVHLRADTGGTQRVHLYALANPQLNHGRYGVELFNDKDEAVKVISRGESALLATSPQEDWPRTLDDDDVLILSLAEGAIGREGDLAEGEQGGLYLRPVKVAHLSPSDLPEHWIALDAVDYVVWDDARPESLSERQLDALLEWVRQGGTLLMAASRSAGAIKLSESLRRVLPVELGETTTVDNLPEIRRQLLGLADVPRRRAAPGMPAVAPWDEPFLRPILMARCNVKPGGVPIVVDRGDASDVLTRGRLGRGHLIFLGVTLRDLFTAPGSPTTFYQRVFGLSVLAAEEAQPTPVSLYQNVVRAVAFSEWGSAYLALAIIFSVIYVLVATLGTWSLLGAKGWRQHSWSAFAAVALVASVLSVFAVNAIRGFGGETLHQVSVVDMDGGETFGHATTFFGLKTGVDRRLDLWLPSDPVSAEAPTATHCFLRPLPVGGDQAASSTPFADPEPYRLVPASAVIGGARVRATLKRFEGRWAGAVGGSVSGEIRLRGSSLEQGSYVTSSLGFDLHNCYLLQLAGAQGLSRQGAPRADLAYAFPIGKLPGDGSRLDLYAAAYLPQGTKRPNQIKNESKLKIAQKAWGAEFRGVFAQMTTGGLGRDVTPGQEKNALLLLSTIGDFDPNTDGVMTSTMFGGTHTWSRDRLRRLDLRDQLTRESVLLVGFADDPGPPRLFRRVGDRPYTRIEPDPEKSWSMYRVRLPAIWSRGSASDEDEDEIQ